MLEVQYEIKKVSKMYIDINFFGTVTDQINEHQGGFTCMRTDTVSETDSHHYDVIRYSLSALRADDTDILFATRKQVKDS